MEQPEGYVDKKHPDKVCLLKKSLYGLNQFSRQWNMRFNEFMDNQTRLRCSKLNFTSSSSCKLLNTYYKIQNLKNGSYVYRSFNLCVWCNTCNQILEYRPIYVVHHDVLATST